MRNEKASSASERIPCGQPSEPIRKSKQAQSSKKPSRRSSHPGDGKRKAVQSHASRRKVASTPRVDKNPSTASESKLPAGVSALLEGLPTESQRICEDSPAEIPSSYYAGSREGAAAPAVGTPTDTGQKTRIVPDLSDTMPVPAFPSPIQKFPEAPKHSASAFPVRAVTASTENPENPQAASIPTYSNLCNCLEDLCYRNPEFIPGRIGDTLLGREIPMITVGSGEKTVLYIGGHHASEWITATVLLHFCRELADFARGSESIFGINRQYYLSNRRLVILPDLNPDGSELALSGLSTACMLADRLERQNGGADFSHWKANARGVDLNHNYAAGFHDYKTLERQKGIHGGCPSGYSGEYPESEPEVAAICNWIRCVQPVAVLTLHTQGEEIYASSCGKTEPHHAVLAKAMERMTGYRFSEPVGGAAYGGLTDWFISEFRRPAFTLECGKGETPLPLEDWFPIYLRLRTLLFRFPYMV